MPQEFHVVYCESQGRGDVRIKKHSFICLFLLKTLLKKEMCLTQPVQEDVLFKLKRDDEKKTRRS